MLSKQCKTRQLICEKCDPVLNRVLRITRANESIISRVFPTTDTVRKIALYIYLGPVHEFFQLFIRVLW